MTELCEIYDLDNNLIGTEERSAFYAQCAEECKKYGKVSKKIKTIRVLLLNSHGKIYVQKRSTTKDHNAGLYDKTIGGHVLAGHTFHITLVKECAEELGIPAVMLAHAEFVKAIPSTDVSVIGVFREIETMNMYESKRITKDGLEYIQPYISLFAIGYYDGAIRFSDGEASGIEMFTRDDLEKDLQMHPQKYTDDMHYFFTKYKKYLVPISDLSST